MVPLNNHETYFDLLQEWKFPVILVVGIKLGCINHALLTYTQLINHKVSILGWIANCLDPQMKFLESNIDYLKNKLNIPLLAINHFQQNLIPEQSFKQIFSRD